ncbi:MAG TPA: helix-turn-helix domain-containing protein [Candidatus Cybelea sp.]|nr:helix-turn-helix domain-containing protein [Candidatus Cybelea sp.]
MSERGYGQFCGFARALETLGDRWALMIVRDLLVGPKRFSDLHAGLPKIPTNVLTSRLKQLEAAGVVERRAMPRPTGGVAYDLTTRGRELDEAVIAIGRWGAKMLDAPRDGEIVTVDSLAMALRTTFRPEAAGDLRARYELHAGEIVLHAIVDGPQITVGRGPLEKPDLIIESSSALKELLAGAMTPRQALASGGMRITGTRKLFDRFAQVFRI